MRKKIFLSCLSVSLIVLAAAFAAMYGIYLYMYDMPPLTLLAELLLPAAGIAAGALLLSLWLAARVAKSITEPINRLSFDGTDSGEVYAELSPLLNRIRQQNRQLTAQMEEMAAEHAQQDAMRRDFTANVSHEMKTPLTSISGYAELLKSGLVEPADVPRFAGKIYDESRRLTTLVGDIIKLSQLDSKEIEVTVEDIDLFALCEGVISHLELAAEKKNVTFSLIGDRVTVRSAEQVVEEIVFNLCDNAVKYNTDGGKVTVSIRQYVDGVELAVTDTGIGISEKDLPHIFDRFYRADKSHSKEIGGTGLGLSIVKHAARFLNATVSVDSTLGVGTTVRVVF